MGGSSTKNNETRSREPIKINRYQWGYNSNENGTIIYLNDICMKAHPSEDDQQINTTPTNVWPSMLNSNKKTLPR